MKMHFVEKVFGFTAIVFICLGVIQVSIASAATCSMGGALPTGTCRDVCGADEVNGTAIVNSFQALNLGGGNCPNQYCCIPKGQALCSFVGTAAVSSGSQISGGWSCAKPCDPGATLTAKYGGLGETCGADQQCCSGAPAASTAAATPAVPKGTPGSPITLTNPLGAGTTLMTIINRIITAFLGLVGALALGVFVYAGVVYMTAGSSDRVKEAVATMKYAVIGLAMIAFSYAITTFLINAFVRPS